MTTTFCRQGYGLKENDAGIYFCKTIIPAFHAGDFEEGKKVQDCNYKYDIAISPKRLMVFHKKNK